MRAVSWLRSPSGLAPHAPTSLRLGAFLATAFVSAPAFFGGGWWGRRKAPAPAPTPAALPFTAEDCVAAADRAMAEGRWPAAAEWLGRAHRLAPTSARVASDLAFALRQLGDVEGALRLYGEAARAGADLGGEPAFHAALACLQSGRSHEEAEAWLARALESEPELAFVVDAEDFTLLRGRPGTEDAIRKARRVASGGRSA